MDRKAVTSSNIKTIGYDKASKVLEVEFIGGKVFQYADVPAKLHTKLMKAKSVGSFFSAEIRNAYDATAIGQD